MCEIMTISAAVAFTVLYFGFCRSRAVFATMLMFWGAALMWSVDCVHSAMDGEPFFDISREDTVLGFIILAAGMVAYGVMALKERFVAKQDFA